MTKEHVMKKIGEQTSSGEVVQTYGKETTQEQGEIHMHMTKAFI